MTPNLNIQIDNFRFNTHFENLYTDDRAIGSSLTLGLRKFNIFFDDACLINTNKPHVKNCITLAKIVLGIFAIPLLGTLALIGIGLNEIHLRLHNRSVKNWARSPAQENTYASKRFAIDPSGKNTQNLKHTVTSNPWKKAVEGIDEMTNKGYFVSELSVTYKPGPSFFGLAIGGGDFEVLIKTRVPDQRDLRKQVYEKAIQMILENPGIIKQ
jgi:hypothetical protein